MADRIYERLSQTFKFLIINGRSMTNHRNISMVLSPQFPKLQTKKATTNSYIIQTPKPNFISNPQTKLNKESQYKLKRRARFKQNQPISASHKQYKKKGKREIK
jgi:poly-D-alanine transfer protein DltD